MNSTNFVSIRGSSVSFLEKNYTGVQYTNVNYGLEVAVHSDNISVNFDPKYMSTFEWEKSVNVNAWREWVNQNWAISVYASVIYLIVIFLGQIWMSKRSPFSLKFPLTLWNWSLAIFSIAGCLRTFPELYNVLMSDEDGLYKSVCVWDKMSNTSATVAWGLFFTLSKIFELGDTLFIVLKKQKLILLHWYHHISVLSYVWLTYFGYEPRVRYFMVMNYFIHGLMYSYYALKSMKIRVPAVCSIILTALQISQMVVGVGVNLYTLYAKMNRNENCRSEYKTIYAALFMYASYFVLFANFFRNAYIKKLKLKQS